MENGDEPEMIEEREEEETEKEKVESERNLEEDALINEEYKIWKKNAPFLYNLVVTNALTWPSLTVQWLPNKTSPANKNFSEHRVLLGSHTSGQEQEFLIIASVTLPKEDTPISAREYGDQGDVGGFGMGSGSVFDIKIRIPHEGEVNRARYMPQNSSVIATKAPSGDVLVFDYTRHPAEPQEPYTCRPEVRLKGHKAEGYGLAWSPVSKGLLLSGSHDGLVCYWDVESATRSGAEMQPLGVLEKHKSEVEDVSWSPLHADIFASVGDDRQLLIWDLRTAERVVIGVKAHSDEVNAVAFHPMQEFLLATASADKLAMIHDLRTLTKGPVHTLVEHNSPILLLQWHPSVGTVLATSAADRRINVWDISRIGDEQTAEEAEDGPPELLFIHGGQTAKACDISWNLNEPWMMANVTEDNILQIWQPAENIFASDEEPRGNEEIPQVLE